MHHFATSTHRPHYRSHISSTQVEHPVAQRDISQVLPEILINTLTYIVLYNNIYTIIYSWRKKKLIQFVQLCTCINNMYTQMSELTALQLYITRFLLLPTTCPPMWQILFGSGQSVSLLDLGEEGVTSLLGISKEHGGVGLEEDRVVNSCVADSQGPLHDDAVLPSPDLQG